MHQKKALHSPSFLLILEETVNDPKVARNALNLTETRQKFFFHHLCKMYDEKL